MVRLALLRGSEVESPGRVDAARSKRRTRRANFLTESGPVTQVAVLVWR